MHEGKNEKSNAVHSSFPPVSVPCTADLLRRETKCLYFLKSKQKITKNTQKLPEVPPNRYANSYGNVEPWNICKMVFAEPQIGTGDQFIRKNRAATPAGTTFSAIRKLPFRFRNSGTDHAMIAGRTTRKSSIPSSNIIIDFQYAVYLPKSAKYVPMLF